MRELIDWTMAGLAFVAMIMIPTMTKVWWHAIPILITFAIIYLSVVWLIGRFGEKGS